MVARVKVNEHTRLLSGQSTPRENESLAVLAALAQPTRLSIFRTLVNREPHGLTAGAIAAAIRRPQNTVSAHVSVLARADLIASTRQGRNILYRAKLSRMGRLIEYLVSECCQGNKRRAPSRRNIMRGVDGVRNRYNTTI